ncbi:hypothetical protein ElyMa_004836300 [Elysia marginata]|uniref:Uncharacterized protein n=1 Tax=Elysia marginata TaxID=1093978 RepID=A0AAV4IMP6_9GAST|nr:hypothetical protein ElyMa_004836300 [Elysia marginata]
MQTQRMRNILTSNLEAGMVCIYDTITRKSIHNGVEKSKASPSSSSSSPASCRDLAESRGIVAVVITSRKPGPPRTLTLSAREPSQALGVARARRPPRL